MRKHNAGELGANKTAIRLLDDAFPELAEEYVDYYNKKNKSTPRAKLVLDRIRRK
jgi:hypothetical protein